MVLYPISTVSERGPSRSAAPPRVLLSVVELAPAVLPQLMEGTKEEREGGRGPDINLPPAENGLNST